MIFFKVFTVWAAARACVGAVYHRVLFCIVLLQFCPFIRKTDRLDRTEQIKGVWYTILTDKGRWQKELRQAAPKLIHVRTTARMLKERR